MIAAALPQVDSLTMGLAVLIAMAFAYRQQVLAYRLRHDLQGLRHDRADEQTGLLSQIAIGLRLEPELLWSELEGKTMAVVLFRVYGNRPERAARAMRRIMRGHENAFLLTPERFLVGLWDVDEDGTRLAIARLASAMIESGARGVDAGFALYPDDVDNLDDMIEVCSQSMRPHNEYAPGGPELPTREIRGQFRRFWGVVQAMGPGLVISIGAMLACYAAYPFVFSFTVPAGSALRTVMLAAVALAAGIVACLWYVWNRGAPGQPGGTTLHHASLTAGVGAFVGTFGMFAWGILGPTYPDPVLQLAGPLWVFDIVLLLTLAQGRFLVRGSQLALLLTFAIFIGSVQLTYDAAPLAANVFRIIAAVSIGALIAVNIERVIFMFVIAAAIAVVDIWSVYSPHGTTSKLVESDSDLLYLLLLTGPTVDGDMMFQLGTADLIFLAVFMSFVHLWRLDVDRNVLALAIALIGSFVASSVLMAGVPVLPFMAIAFLLANMDTFREEIVDLLGRNDLTVPGSTADPGGGTVVRA